MLIYIDLIYARSGTGCPILIIEGDLIPCYIISGDNLNGIVITKITFNHTIIIKIQSNGSGRPYPDPLSGHIHIIR